MTMSYMSFVIKPGIYEVCLNGTVKKYQRILQLLMVNDCAVLLHSTFVINGRLYSKH